MRLVILFVTLLWSPLITHTWYLFDGTATPKVSYKPGMNNRRVP